MPQSARLASPCGGASGPMRSSASGQSALMSPRSSAMSILARAASQDTVGLQGSPHGMASSASVMSILSSPRMGLCQSAVDLRTVAEAGVEIDSRRLMSAEEEIRLKLKGDKERRLQLQRDARERHQKTQLRESSVRAASRDRLEREVQETREREAEADKRKRLWDIEERQRMAELRSWEREQKVETEASIKISPRLSPRSPSHDLSREERHRLEERRLKEKAEKELVHMQAKEVNRQSRELRAESQREVHTEFARRQARVEAQREEQRRLAVEVRKRGQVQREMQYETRALGKKTVTEQQSVKEIHEYTRREQDKLRKEQELKTTKLQDMRVKGERERLQREAKELRAKEQELVKRQETLSKASVEQQVQALAEAKERKEHGLKLRRFLEIEQRQGRAEAERRDREQRKRSEDDRNAVYFVPPAPKARLVGGRLIDGRSSCRSLSPSFCGVGGG